MLCYCFQGFSKNPVQEWDDPLLLLSTLDGSFYGVGQKTGYIRWTLKDGKCGIFCCHKKGIL
jgi:hypothetical protein